MDAGDGGERNRPTASRRATGSSLTSKGAHKGSPGERLNLSSPSHAQHLIGRRPRRHPLRHAQDLHHQRAVVDLVRDAPNVDHDQAAHQVLGQAPTHPAHARPARAHPGLYLSPSRQPDQDDPGRAVRRRDGHVQAHDQGMGPRGAHGKVYARDRGRECRLCDALDRLDQEPAPPGRPERERAHPGRAAPLAPPPDVRAVRRIPFAVVRGARRVHRRAGAQAQPRGGALHDPAHGRRRAQRPRGDQLRRRESAARLVGTRTGRGDDAPDRVLGPA